MDGARILVLGGTGPAGVCLLRELIHRGHASVVYARNPSKIPGEIAENRLIKVVKGELKEILQHTDAIGDVNGVVSLLGPNINDKGLDSSVYAHLYKDYVFPLMRLSNIRRINAMCTISVTQASDHWSFFSIVVRVFMRLFASAIYDAIHQVASTFESEAQGLDWILFRIAQVPGDSDEASWRKDRQAGEIFTGWVGEPGWTPTIKRGALARWLVDAAEGNADKWIGKMPALSDQASS